MGHPESPSVILADPPLGSAWTPYASAHPNLGLLYLAATLQRYAPQLDVCYLDGRQSLHQHLRAIRQRRPVVYGLSFSSPFAAQAYAVINAVKSRHEDTFVLCGGAHSTADPENVLGSSRADACCLGEGEQTLLEVVRSRLGGTPVSNVAGLAYRDGSGAVAFAPPRRLASSLDALPFPAWDLVDFAQYGGCRPSRARWSTAIVASRGCPFRCTFCSSPVWKLQKPWLRVRSPDNIAREVEVLYSRGVREIYIRSDEMNPDSEWCVSVFRALRDLRKTDLYFQCNLRAAPMTADLARALAEARCWLVNLGVESACQRVLDGIGKGITSAEVEYACRVLKAQHIKIRAFMMLYQAWERDGQLQCETSADVCCSLRFVLRLYARGLIDLIGWAFATPYPGSALYDTAVRHKLLLERPAAQDAGDTHRICMRLPHVARREMVLARAAGLALQGICALRMGGYFRAGGISRNANVALRKLRHIVRPW